MLYALADGGALCNHWYSSVLGPTWPNRYYLHGATSRGRRSNFPITGFTSIFERLRDAGISHPQPPPVIPDLRISMREIERRPAQASHSEPVRALADRQIPRHLDRRGRDL